MSDLIGNVRRLAEAATDDIYSDAHEVSDRVEVQHLRAAEILEELKTKHTVHVLWGEAPDPEEPSTDVFTFDTKAELDAFRMGVAAMDGWGGYQMFDSADELEEAVQELKDQL